LDFDTLPTSVFPALEYISNKLLSRMTPVTLVVGREKTAPNGQLGQLSELIAIPISPLDAQTWRNLKRAVTKATKRFYLGPGWVDALQQSRRHCNEYLLHQSILQNEVLFSQEGLTLLNIDRIYTFKRRLHTLSEEPPDVPIDLYISSCVQLLQKTIRDHNGRPFSKAYFYRVYDHLQFRDDLLLQVARQYKDTHGQIGIVLPEKVREQPRPRVITAVRTISPARRRRKTESPRRRPRTPLTASDVTPITLEEWKMLMAQNGMPESPNVGFHVPIPVKPVGG
jgi:hypothetical protein